MLLQLLNLNPTTYVNNLLRVKQQIRQFYPQYQQPMPETVE